MRITRAAKVAAFPLIVLALVALVACQGGPGTKGDTGDMGTMGAPGTNAPIPLTGRVGPVLIDSFNAGKDDNEATEFKIDLTTAGRAGYFNGGEGPYKFTRGAITDHDGPADADTLTASIDKDDTNILKLKLNAGSAYSDDDYMDGFTVAVSAVDVNQERALSSVTVKPNRAPLLNQTPPSVQEAAGVLTGDNASFTVGTMAGDIDIDAGVGGMAGNQPRPDGAASCTTFNSCVLSLFQDHGDYDVSVVSDPDGKFSWSDEGEGKLKLTGLVAASDVDVDVEAKDKDGLTKKVRFMLTVNAAPTPSEHAAALETSIELEQGLTTKLFENVLAAMAAFADDDDVMVSYMSGNPSIVSIDDVTLTGEAVGTATVYAVGTTGVQGGNDDDGLGQSVKIAFTVRVTPSSSSASTD